jgi:hypothetical protein
MRVITTIITWPWPEYFFRSMMCVKIDHVIVCFSDLFMEHNVTQ